MKISLNWIKEYTKVILPTEELRDRISVSLTEVESMEEFGERYAGMVVSEIKKIQPHPTSDGLLILTLDIGKKNVTVVVQKCPVTVGAKVPYLPPGTGIPGEIGGVMGKDSVKATTIKGVSSEGMVPSGREMGLNHDHTTVYELPGDSSVGTPVNQTLDLVDQIIEIKNKALTHRPDTFSIEGLAREIAAIQGTAFKPLSWMGAPESIKPEVVEPTLELTIVNNARALCPRYIAVVLDNVNVGPSPQWLQIRLAKLGVRPVNNVVDISNYLMMEAGQPSHAFDYDKVVKKDVDSQGKAVITVRMANGGERITTLDGQSRELSSDAIIVADSTNPIGIAGVMGGKDTEIDEQTKRVIFQVENLDMYSVRRTSMKLGIFSDAVTRFSKGLDPNRCEPVLYKGIQMLSEYAGAVLATNIIDDYPSPIRERAITFSPALVRSRIGSDIPDERMEKILTSLCLAVKQDKKNKTMTVVVPTFRRDLSIAQDIDEEIVRIYGYDRLKPTLPTRSTAPTLENEPREHRLRIKNILCSLGANEFYTYSFVGKALYEGCNLDLSGSHMLRNSLSPELKYMRPVIVPSLLEKVPLNISSRKEYAGFEIDLVNPVSEGSGTRYALPEEPRHLGIVHTISYYHAKLYVEDLMKSLYVREWSCVPVGKTDKGLVPSWIQHLEPMYNQSRLAYIRVESGLIGMVGEIHLLVAEALSLPHGISAAEMRVKDLEPTIGDTPYYRDPSKYPEVTHDLCFVTDSSVPYRVLVNAVSSVDCKAEVLRSIECLDIYVGKNMPNVKKTTLRVTMQRYDRTLEEQDITTLRQAIIDSVKKSVDGVLAK